MLYKKSANQLVVTGKVMLQQKFVLNKLFASSKKPLNFGFDFDSATWLILYC